MHSLQHATARLVFSHTFWPSCARIIETGTAHLAYTIKLLLLYADDYQLKNFTHRARKTCNGRNTERTLSHRLNQCGSRRNFSAQLSFFRINVADQPLPEKRRIYGVSQLLPAWKLQALCTHTLGCIWWEFTDKVTYLKIISRAPNTSKPMCRGVNRKLPSQLKTWLPQKNSSFMHLVFVG